MQFVFGLIYSATQVLNHTGEKRLLQVYSGSLICLTQDCDCFGTKKKVIIDNLGLLGSTDPVALDAATLDLTESRNKPLSDLCHSLSRRVQRAIDRGGVNGGRRRAA